MNHNHDETSRNEMKVHEEVLHNHDETTRNEMKVHEEVHAVLAARVCVLHAVWKPVIELEGAALAEIQGPEINAEREREREA